MSIAALTKVGKSVSGALGVCAFFLLPFGLGFFMQGPVLVGYVDGISIFLLCKIAWWATGGLIFIFFAGWVGTSLFRDSWVWIRNLVFGEEGGGKRVQRQKC